MISLEPEYRDSWLESSYEDRVQVLLDLALAPYPDSDPAAVTGASLADLAMLIAQGRHVAACEADVRSHLEAPGTGPFWMMQLVLVMYGGGQALSPSTHERIRRSWEQVRQLRGDTENHWVLFHACLYLAVQWYGEDEPDWENGRTSRENRDEATRWLEHWVHDAVRLGQTEYNPTHYIAEYAIPLLMLVAWARDEPVRARAEMMLDHLFAELAAVSLHGVLRGPHSRTDDLSVVEPWNSMGSLYSWLLFGVTQPATSRNGWWNGALAQLAHVYRPPEVIRRIATDPEPERLRRDRARSRRMLRHTDVEHRTILKTHYLRPGYAVGSTQGGLSDPIQSHVWDVTWHESDPRGKQPRLFSVHPHQTGTVLQAFFSCAPEPMAQSVPHEGKPSFGRPDTVLGASPYEQVVQHLDTVVALYDVPPDAPVQHVNIFLSRDLHDLESGPSGWWVGRGGEAWVACRPLTDVDVDEHLTWTNGWDPDSSTPTGSRLLVTRTGVTGVIVQVAAVEEYPSASAFRAAVEAAPLEFALSPRPRVRLRSIRGAGIEIEHGRPPVVDGRTLSEDDWPLLGGPHLSSALGSGVVEIRHGDLRRVLDFRTLTTTDHDLLGPPA